MVLANLIPDPHACACLVIGDLNICSREAASHSFLEFLSQKGFKCLLTEATHIDGGGLDQAWLRITPDSSCVANAIINSKYYTAKDHNGILFTLHEEDKSKVLSFYPGIRAIHI